MSDFNFTTALSNQIVEYSQIPKLQVERIVGPILSLFLEDILSKLLIEESKGQYIQLILPEFPLKKDDSNQSTNIDWLLLNKEAKKIYFVELKTAVSSLNKDQLELYNQYKYKIKHKSAIILFRDFKKVMHHSDKKKKYQSAFNKIKSFEEVLRETYDLSIIYIVPFPLKERILYSVDHVFSFSDLPDKISSDKDTDWIEIRKALIKLDSNQTQNDRVTPLEKTDKVSYLKEILQLIRTKYPDKSPQKIWLGKTGSGYRPNFQVGFQDGQIQPYYSNGNPYTRKPVFKSQNLDGPYDINEIEGNT